MREYFQKTTSAAPLALFRIAFGLLLLAGTVRFWAKGWIHELYIQPIHFFPFYGLEFVKPLGPATYGLFFICGVASLMVALGLYYRIASLALFLSFTYIELMDKTTYLNHYYFISMLGLMLLFLPAHVYFSLDAYRRPRLRADRIPAWCVDSIRLFVAFLYFFAGLSKLNSDWLLEALPLRIWLPAHNDLPIIGSWLNERWVAFAFSWIGCVYDLTIPFLLWYRRTRLGAFVAVVVFHGLTALLFPIGMFPYVMMITALIYFPERFHLRFFMVLATIFSISRTFLFPQKTLRFPSGKGYLLRALFAGFFLIQLLVPFRYLFYPGELFWTEQGYRFSWRVMLMEKAGHAQFIVKDTSGHRIMVNNEDFLTPLQEKMMATQPDMILQYAHILRDYYRSRGMPSPQVYADAYVVLNGRMGRPLVDTAVNLSNEYESFCHKSWVLPFQDEIKGF